MTLSLAGMCCSSVFITVSDIIDDHNYTHYNYFTLTAINTVITLTSPSGSYHQHRYHYLYYYYCHPTTTSGPPISLVVLVVCGGSGGGGCDDGRRGRDRGGGKSDRVL